MINLYGKSPHDEKLRWDFVKERAFLFGNVIHDILETLISLNPSLKNA
jgi:hypothetical protein